MNGNEEQAQANEQVAQAPPIGESPVTEAAQPPPIRSGFGSGRGNVNNFGTRWSQEDKEAMEKVFQAGWTGEKIDWVQVRIKEPALFSHLMTTKGERAVYQAGYKLRDKMKDGRTSTAKRMKAARLARLGATISHIKPKPSHHSKYYVPAAKRRVMEAQQLSSNGPAQRSEVPPPTPTPPAAVQGLLPSFCPCCGFSLRQFTEALAQVKARNEGS